jgi:MFS family permease
LFAEPGLSRFATIATQVVSIVTMTIRDMQMGHTAGVAFSVYAGGLLLGMTLVSVPASSALLMQLHSFSDAQYGSIYLPQLLCAIVGGLGGGLLTDLLGTKRLLVVALGCLFLAQATLAASAVLPPELALPALMLATGCIGLGIGLGGGPLNAYPVILFPKVPNAALTALHTTVGVGMMLSPVYLSTFAQAGHWLPGVIALSATTSIVTSIAIFTRFPSTATGEIPLSALATRPERHALFWICALIAVLYSVAEGIFSNWAMLFIQEERQLDAATASLALTCFWAALTFGRLLASFIVMRVSPVTFLVGLPLAMAAAFWWLPTASGSSGLIGAFAFAGLACSAYFPMLVAYAAAAYPHRVSWIASMMITAQMVGIGLGTYAVGMLKGTSSIAELYRAAVALPIATSLLLVLAWRLRPAAPPPVFVATPPTRSS